MKQNKKIILILVFILGGLFVKSTFNFLKGLTYMPNSELYGPYLCADGKKISIEHNTNYNSTAGVLTTTSFSIKYSSSTFHILEYPAVREIEGSLGLTSSDSMSEQEREEYLKIITVAKADLDYRGYEEISKKYLDSSMTGSQPQHYELISDEPMTAVELEGFKLCFNTYAGKFYNQGIEKQKAQDSKQGKPYGEFIYRTIDLSTAYARK